MSNDLSFDLSSVPKEWSIIPCGIFFKEKSIKNTQGEINLSVYRDYGVIPKDSRDDNHNRVSQDTSNYKLVEPGDFVLNKMKGWSGSLGVSDYRGIVSPSYTVLEPVREIHNKYFHYLLRSEIYRQIYESLSYGVRVGQWELRYHDFKQIPSLYPPIEEQKLISRYLDKKTQQIDSLVEKVRKKIELLKEQRTSLINQYVTKGLDPNVEMKDSGVEWIDEVPKHWKLGRVKYLAERITKGTTPSNIGEDYDEYGTVRFIKGEDLIDGEISKTGSSYISDDVDKKIIRSQLKVNDLLVVIAGTLGKCAIVTREVLPANTNQAISLVRFRDRIDPFWVRFWFETSFCKQQIDVCAVVAAQPNLSMEDLGNISIPLPPEEEQNLIIDFLKEKTKNIDLLVSKETIKLDLLAEYRQSLISSVVIGKVRVSEDMV